MGRRRSIHIPPVKHGAPIPMAAVVGDILMSSGIIGADPRTGILGTTAEQQAQFAFANLERVIAAAKGSIGDVVHVTVFLQDFADRGAVNEPWLRMFPDEDDRPARHTLRADLPGELLVQIEVVAVLDTPT
jgi:2-iminobutanoate/2-iminopropanoate deaminase